VSGIKHLSTTISKDMAERLPGQRKTQRENLSLMVATSYPRRYDGVFEGAFNAACATFSIAPSVLSNLLFYGGVS
jgi:hypothetical protein